MDVIGLGIIIPVLPDLIKELGGGNPDTTTEYGESGGIGGLLLMTFAAMQFLFAPVLGELSDRFGRRPVLLIALAGLGVDYILHAVAPTLLVLFIGRFIAGICGASFSVASAYIADVSTAESKAKNFGLIGVAFGLGFIVGPLLGGVIGDALGTRAPFWVAAILTLLNMVYGFFILPESLPKADRRVINFSKMIPGKSLKYMSRYKALGGLMLAFFLAQTAGQALPSTWSFFTMEMFDWDKSEVGYSLAVVGLCVGAVQGGLVGVVVKKLGQRKTIILGFSFWTVGMLLFSQAFQGWMLYAFLVPYAFGGIASPTLQGYISNQIPRNEQGNLQGTLTSLIGLASILGPAIASSLFYLFTVHKSSLWYFPGAPYAMGALLLLLATLTVIRVSRNLDETPVEATQAQAS